MPLPDVSTAPFFEYLPSAWSEFFGDDGQFKATLEAYLHAQESAYRVAAQVDSAKALSELEPWVRYPTIYEKPTWAATGAHHQHVHTEHVWPGVDQDNMYWLDPMAGAADQVEVWLDGLYVPSALYRLRPAPGPGFQVGFQAEQLDEYLTSITYSAGASVPASAITRAAVSRHDRRAEVTSGFTSYTQGQEEVGSRYVIRSVEHTLKAVNGVYTVPTDSPWYEISDGTLVQVVRGGYTTTSVLEYCKELINWDLSPGVTTVGADYVESQRMFRPGMRIYFEGSNVTTTVDTYANRVAVPAGSHGIVYLNGVPLNGDRVRQLDQGTELVREFSAWSLHAHAEHQGTVGAGPYSVTGVDSVYVDGQLIPGADWTDDGTTTTITGVYPDAEVSLFSEGMSTDTHEHALQDQVPATTAETRLLVSVPAFDGSVPQRVYRDGWLDTLWVSPKAGDQLTFLTTAPVSPGTRIHVANAITRFPYVHVIPERVDSPYGWSGTLYDVGTVSALPKGPDILWDLQGDQFYAESPHAELWLHDVQVDERYVQDRWGHALGLEGPTSEALRDTVAAFQVSRFSPSTADTVENLGSVVMGSPYLKRAAVSLGGTGTAQKFKDDQDKEFVVNVLPKETRITQERMGRFWALNKLVTVHTDNPWLPYMAAELGQYRLSHKFDDRRPDTIVGHAPQYANGVLTDASQDFGDARAGDLLCFELTTAPAATVQGYVYDSNGFTVGAVSFDGVNLIIQVADPLVTVAPLLVPDGVGNIWNLAVLAGGAVVSTLVGPGVVVAPASGGYALEVDAQGVLFPQPTAAPDELILSPGPNGEVWRYRADGGTVTTSPATVPVELKGTDGSSWLLIWGTGPELYPNPGASTDLRLVGDQGGQWLLTVDPLGPTLVYTLETPVPAVAPTPVYRTTTQGHKQLLVVSGQLGVQDATFAAVQNYDRYAAGQYINIVGGLDLGLNAAYQILSSTLTGAQLTVVVPYVQGPTTGGPVTFYAVLPLSFADQPQLTGNKIYAVIQSAALNTLSVDVTNSSTLFGYGQGFYGEGGLGGSLIQTQIARYTLYVTRPIGSTLAKDVISEKDRVAEALLLAQSLPRVVCIERDRDGTFGAADNLSRMIDEVLPADTRGFLITRAPSPQDERGVSVDPDVSTITRDPASYSVGGPISGPVSSSGAYTNNPNAWTALPGIVGCVAYPPSVDGRYVVAPNTALPVQSPYANLFGPGAGLGNEILQVTGSQSFVHSGELRRGRSVSADTQLFVVPDVGVGTQGFPAGHQLSAAAPNIDMWIEHGPAMSITWGAHAATLDADITWGPLAVPVTPGEHHVQLILAGGQATIVLDGVPTTGAWPQSAAGGDLVITGGTIKQLVIQDGPLVIPHVAEAVVVRADASGVRIYQPDGQGNPLNYLEVPAISAHLFWDGQLLDYSGHGHTAVGGASVVPGMPERRRQSGDLRAMSPLGLLCVANKLITQATFAGTGKPSPTWLAYGPAGWQRLPTEPYTSSSSIGVDTTTA